MKVRVLDIVLQQKEQKVLNTESKKFRKYLKEGFYVCSRTNEYALLKKDEGILVIVEYEGNATTGINLERELARYYGKKASYKTLIKNFEKDLKNKQIKLKLNPKTDCWYIVAKQSKEQKRKNF